jgi:hypothetical protein
MAQKWTFLSNRLSVLADSLPTEFKLARNGLKVAISGQLAALPWKARPRAGSTWPKMATFRPFLAKLVSAIAQGPVDLT